MTSISDVSTYFFPAFVFTNLFLLFFFCLTRVIFFFLLLIFTGLFSGNVFQCKIKININTDESFGHSHNSLFLTSLAIQSHYFLRTIAAYEQCLGLCASLAGLPPLVTALPCRGEASRPAVPLSGLSRRPFATLHHHLLLASSSISYRHFYVGFRSVFEVLVVCGGLG